MYKLLDIYCGAGLAAIGYRQAGFHVTGVDNQTKSCYAGDKFILGDALEILQDIDFCNQFDAIHTSPPCQKHSTSTAPQRREGKIYPEMIAPTRLLLTQYNMPTIIENVYTAPVRMDLLLRGDMFGLNVLRKRKFEFQNWWIMQPQLPKQVGSVADGDYCTIIGKQGYRKSKGQPKGWRPKFDQGSALKTWAFAMGIPPKYKFKDVEISEGIPPAYTKYIGEQLITFLNYNKWKIPKKATVYQ
jgi:DNA (cytosine-5)-methyltransferase 1